MHLKTPIVAETDTRRRHRPSIIHTDWLVLRELASAIECVADVAIEPNDRVIDFGCGAQPYRALFEERGAHYEGADFDAGAQLHIRENGTISVADDVADVVTSFQVLEHVRDLGCYLSEAGRILKPEGELILSTHGTWLFHPHPEDHRRWTRMGLIGELEAHGWHVTYCQSLVGPLAFTTLIRLTGFCFALRKIPLLGPILSAPLALLMNVRAVLEDALTPRSIRDDNACVYLVRARRAKDSK